jgi:type II secretory pathway component PulK
VRGRRSRRGVALLLVLGVVVSATAAAATLAAAAHDGMDTTATLRARATARSMAESGIAAAEIGLADAVVQRDTAALLAAVRASADGAALVADTLGDGAFVAAVEDPGARLDVNRADVRALALLFSSVLPPADAGRAAAAIEARRTPAGRAPTRRLVVRDLQALRELPGLDGAGWDRLAPLLTVDGDGTITRPTAGPLVRAAAAGSLVDVPTRLVVVARGFRLGHPLTHEITAVYEIADGILRLVAWRERDL